LCIIYQIFLFQCAGPWLLFQLDSEFDSIFFQIFIPLVYANHKSLIVVSTSLERIYILDSWPGKHISVAADFVNKLKTYLITNHNMDIAVYP